MHTVAPHSEALVAATLQPYMESLCIHAPIAMSQRRKLGLGESPSLWICLFWVQIGSLLCMNKSLFYREKSVRTLKYQIATINNHNRVSFVVNGSLWVSIRVSLCVNRSLFPREKSVRTPKSQIATTAYCIWSVISWISKSPSRI